jgi:hypothetical protein
MIQIGVARTSPSPSLASDVAHTKAMRLVIKLRE